MMLPSIGTFPLQVSLLKYKDKFSSVLTQFAADCPNFCKPAGKNFKTHLRK